MPIKTGGEHPPLFCVHGEPLKFAMTLKADRPVYGLCYAYHGFKRSDMPKTIEDYARLYLKELRSIQPKGPYYLCGYSAGGLIAYEMCQMLIKEGEEIGDLTLVEPTVYFIGKRKIGSKTIKRFSRTDNKIKLLFNYIKALPQYVAKRSVKNFRQASTSLSLKFNLYLLEVLRMPGFLMVLKPIMRQYIYQPMDIGANLIYVNMDQQELESMQNYWGDLLHQPKIYVMKGVRKHLDLMEEPALSETIALLDKSVLSPSQH